MTKRTFVRSYASGGLEIEHTLHPKDTEQDCIEQEIVSDPEAMERLLTFVRSDDLLLEALTELVVAGFTLGQEHPRAP